MTLDDMTAGSVSPRILSNEISAPYEVPQFPIEQLEKKLAIQRQLSSRYRAELRSSLHGYSAK
jgi:AMP deaminase